MAEKRARIYLIDAVRGAALLGMILHHFLVDLESYWFIPIPWIHQSWFYTVQLVFVAAFLIISGACTQVSRSVAKRGWIVLAGATAVSLVTWLMDSNAYVVFGILHLMGCSMLIYAALRRWLDRIPPKAAALLWLVLFCVCYYFFRTLPRITVPGLFPFGLPDIHFVSTDYYPILPYLFLFFLGTVLGKPIFSGKLPGWFYEKRLQPLAFVGRNSLWVYLLHQPVLFGLLCLILGLPW